MPARRSRQIYAADVKPADIDDKVACARRHNVNGPATSSDHPDWSVYDPDEGHQQIQCDREYQRRINHIVADLHKNRRERATAKRQHADIHGVVQQDGRIQKVAQQVAGKGTAKHRVNKLDNNQPSKDTEQNVAHKESKQLNAATGKVAQQHASSKNAAPARNQEMKAKALKENGRGSRGDWKGT